MESNKQNKMHILNKKIYFLVMMIIVVIVGSLGVYMYELEKENAIKNFEELGENYTKQTVSSLLYWAEEQKKRAQLVATEKTVIAACIDPQNIEKKELARTFVKKINGQNTEIEDVLVIYVGDETFIDHIDGSATHVTSGDYLIDSSGGEMIGKSAVGKTFYDNIISGSSYYYSEIYGSVKNSEPIFTISIPIKHEKEIVGVSLVTTKTRAFSEKFLDSTKYKDTGYLFIVDEKKNIIAHPEEKYILKGERVEHLFEDITSKILEGKISFNSTFLGKKKHFVSRLVIESEDVSNNWYVVFGIEDDELFKTANEIREFLIGNAIFGIILLGSIILIVIHNYQVSLSQMNLENANTQLNKEIDHQTKELYLLSKSDSLTGLYNHNAIFEILKDKIDNLDGNYEPLCIIMFDLDHFKNVNDIFGHLIGDEVIVKVANAIKNEIRETDYIGRYGGEEFMIILTDTAKEIASNRAEHFRTIIENLNWSVENLRVTASFGVKALKNENLEELITEADGLLYKAKEKGRNRVES